MEPLIRRRTVKAVIYDETRDAFLLVRSAVPSISRAERGYGLVGGGVRKGEALRDAICREMREEIGLEEADIGSLSEAGRRVISRQGWSLLGIENTTSLFWVRVANAPALRLSWEIKTFVWAPREKVESLLSPHYRNLFAEALRGEPK